MDIPFLRENDRKTQTNKKKPLPAPRRDKQPGRFMSPQPRSFLWFKPSRTQLTDRSAACFPLPGRYFRLSGLKSTNKEGRLSPHRLLPLARNRNSTQARLPGLRLPVTSPGGPVERVLQACEEYSLLVVFISRFPDRGCWGTFCNPKESPRAAPAAGLALRGNACGGLSRGVGAARRPVSG